jgi:hypothetical protein
VRQVLQVSGDGNVGFADASVFLVDGSIRIAFANDCVIIASGAVEVSHGRRNVIVAGHYIHTSHDGNPRPRAIGPAGPNAAAGGPNAGAAAAPNPPGGEGSLLVSGRVIDVSHATGTILSAPGVVRVSHAQDATFINSPDVQTSHQDNCRGVNVAPLPLAPPLLRNPLEGKLKVSQVVRGDDSRRGAMVVIEHQGVEVAVRPGAPVRDGKGDPLPGLEGWSLSFVGDDVAIFSHGTDLASFYVPTKP